jgi:hypothetical protein
MFSRWFLPQKLDIAVLQKTPNQAIEKRNLY